VRLKRLITIVIFISGLILVSFVFASSCETEGPEKSQLVLGERIPNASEADVVGSLEQAIGSDSQDIRYLVLNMNPNIIFKDEELGLIDHYMTPRLNASIVSLSELVQAEWPGQMLRVTEAWDTQLEHSPNSLHYEGRAADLTVSDQDTTKLGRLGCLAVQAGLDWVYYEDASHIHVSVKRDVNLMLSGTLSEFTTNEYVTPEESEVVAHYLNPNMMFDGVYQEQIEDEAARGTVDKNGNFQLVCTTPTMSKMFSVTQFYRDVEVSSATARLAVVWHRFYVEYITQDFVGSFAPAENLGEVFTLFNLKRNNGQFQTELVEGEIETFFFVYANENVTIKGTRSDAIEVSERGEAIYPVTVDLELKQGWNKVFFRARTNVVKDSSYDFITFREIYQTTNPAGFTELGWYFLDSYSTY
jgi:Hedgehog amino-terminal signalling domain